MIQELYTILFELKEFIDETDVNSIVSVLESKGYNVSKREDEFLFISKIDFTAEFGKTPQGEKILANHYVTEKLHVDTIRYYLTKIK